MDDNIVSKRILESIERKNVSYGILSELTGIPKSAIHRYATGETPKIPIDRVESIAKALGVTAAYLMGWEEEPDAKYPEPRITDDVVTFPVIGEVAAGFEHIALEDWSGDTVDIPAAYLHGRPKSDYMVLTVKGDSMYPLYLEGDKVMVLKTPTLARSGEIGLVRYEGENATLKKVEYVDGEDWMKLLPLNPAYPPRTITGADLQQCAVIGIPRLVIREIEQ